MFESGSPVSLHSFIVMDSLVPSFLPFSYMRIVVGNLLRDRTPVPQSLFELLVRLSGDASAEVRSFAVRASLEESAKRPGTPPPEDKRGRARLEQVSLFSRPPISSVHRKTEADLMEEVPEFLIIERDTMTESDSQLTVFDGFQGDVAMDASTYIFRP